MQFLLFDVTATLLFLLSYATVLTVRQRTVLAPAAISRTPHSPGHRARALEQPAPRETPKQRPAQQPPRREWPRLSAPR